MARAGGLATAGSNPDHGKYACGEVDMFGEWAGEKSEEIDEDPGEDENEEALPKDIRKEEERKRQRREEQKKNRRRTEEVEEKVCKKRGKTTNKQKKVKELTSSVNPARWRPDCLPQLLLFREASREGLTLAAGGGAAKREKEEEEEEGR